jgi:Domain of unknown function (DUF4397)
MTSELISRRNALLGTLGTVAAGSLTLSGCGGSGSDSAGSAQLRALNLTSDLPSIDLFTDDTSQFAALAPEALVAYKGVDAKEYTLRVKKAGDGATLLSGTYSLGKDQNFTAVIWGRETALRLSTLPENEDNNAIASGNTRVRMFNATTDSGAVDVFFTSATAELGDTAPTQSAVGSGSLSGFREISAGTYRLRVTGVGDPNDVRLDITGVALTAKQHYNLVLTAGTGGVLLNGMLIQQQAAAVVMRNTRARVRVVAGVDGGGVVAVSAAGTTLVGGLRSPSVGPYQLVNAGNLALQVRVNGAVVVDETRTLVAGADYTLMAFGPLAGAGIRLIADDNRLPSLSNRVKLRLIHGANGVDPITLSADYLALATDVTAGNASAYATTTSGAAVRIDVTAATAVAPLYTAETVNLQGQSVYTVFLLGGNATPTGVIRKER